MTFHPTNNPVFWKTTAEQLLDAGRFEKAAEAFRQLTELMPNDPDAWRGRARSLQSLEHYGDAVAAFERTLILVPDDIISLNGLAACYEALGNREKMAACMLRLDDLGGN